MSTRDRYWLPVILLVLIDIAVFGGAILLAYQVRFSAWFTESVWAPPQGTAGPAPGPYGSLALYAVVFGLIILDRFGFYRYREGLDRGRRPIAFVLAVIVCYVFLMAWLFLYVHGAYAHSRLVVLLGLFFTIGIGLASHKLLREAMRHLVASGIGFTRTLLVGGEDDCREVLERLRSAHGSRHQVIGFVGTNGKRPDGLNGVPVLGTLSDISEVLRRHKIDRVIVALPEKHGERAWEVLRACRQRKVECCVVPQLFESMTLNVDVAKIDALPVISLGETPLAGDCITLKRMMDVVIGSVALVVASPLMLLFSILIKLDSEGPIIFKQERISSDGQPFIMYKFRTMHKDAEKGGPVWAKANDPRCTRFGRWLRRTNLDELPQLFNVLNGSMSLVGPRPERSYFVNQFKQSIPQYMRRHMVKSGITGWAQIHGLRGNTSVEERTEYDMFYIENWSLLLDLKILLRTPVSNKNAY